MAKSFQKRERNKHIRVMRRYRTQLWYLGAQPYWGWKSCHVRRRHDWDLENHERREALTRIKRCLEKSVHNGISEVSRTFYRRKWRRAGKRICELHLLGEHDAADALDPQPKRLGIMWQLY